MQKMSNVARRSRCWLASLCLLAACGSSLEGTWEQTENTTMCGKMDFSLADKESGLVGDGIAPIADGSTCINCKFDIVAREKESGEWSLTLDFETCAFTITGLQTKRLELDCNLEDTAKLKCSSPLGGLVFDKVN